MAGDWIPISLGLWEDPALLRISRRLGVSRYDSLGRVVRFWSWVSAHYRDGSLKDADRDAVDAIVEKKGFADAMIDARWLAESDDKSLSIPNFDEWMGHTAKLRLDTVMRKRRSRMGHKTVTILSQDGHKMSQETVTCHALQRTEDRGHISPTPLQGELDRIQQAEAELFSRLPACVRDWWRTDGRAKGNWQYILYGLNKIGLAEELSMSGARAELCRKLADAIEAKGDDGRLVVAQVWAIAKKHAMSFEAFRKEALEFLRRYREGSNV